MRLLSKRLAVLVSGTVLSQLVIIAASPLLTRLYDPTEFGVFAVFIALASVLAVVANLRFEMAIPIPSSDRAAHGLVWLSIFSAIGVSAATAVAVAIWRDSFAASIGEPGLATWLWLLPPAILAIGVFQALYFASLRAENYRSASIAKLSRSLATAIIQIAAYPLGPGGLVLGQAAGYLGGIGTLFRNLGKPIYPPPRRAFLQALIIEYRSFPLWSSWSGLFNAIGLHAAPILLAFLYSATVAGLFALTVRVLSTPAVFVGQAVADILLKDAANARKEKKLMSLTISVAAQMGVVALVPLTIIMIFGPTLFEIVFGSEWRDAGQIARWLSPWLAVVFVASPLTRFYPVLNKNHVSAIADGLILAARLGAILVGYAIFENYLQTIQLFAVVSFVGWAAYLLLTMMVVRNDVVHD